MILNRAGPSRERAAASGFNLSAALRDIRVAGSDWARIVHSGQQGIRLAKPHAVLLHLVTRGSVILQVGHDRPVKMNISDLAILPTGTEHLIRTETSLPAERWHYFDHHHGLDIVPDIEISAGAETQWPHAAVTLSGALNVEWPEGFSLWNLMPPVVVFKGSRSSNARMRVRAIEVSAAKIGGSYGLTKYAEMGIGRMFQELFDKSEPPLPVSGDAEAAKIHQAVGMIEASPGQPWSVAGLAEAVGMSRSAFAERFQKVTGRTPMEVVQDLRMKSAARLLRRPDLRVKEVAAQVGYQSEASFARTFSRVFGLPPRDYRRQSMPDPS
jgi:AraC-like DNA-binding protein